MKIYVFPPPKPLSLQTGLRIQSDIDDQTSQDIPDPDPWIFKDRFWIQTPLSWKFYIYFMMSFNKKLFFFIFWRSLVINFKFSSDTSLLETFFQNLGWNRIQKIWKPDPDPCKNTGSGSATLIVSIYIFHHHSNIEIVLACLLFLGSLWLPIQVICISLKHFILTYVKKYFL